MNATSDKQMCLALRAFFSDSTTSSYGQIRCYTQSSALIVLLYALHTLEKFWLPNVYFDRHNNIFIKS